MENLEQKRNDYWEWIGELVDGIEADIVHGQLKTQSEADERIFECLDSDDPIETCSDAVTILMVTKNPYESTYCAEHRDRSIKIIARAAVIADIYEALADKDSYRALPEGRNMAKKKEVQRKKNSHDDRRVHEEGEVGQLEHKSDSVSGM